MALPSLAAATDTARRLVEPVLAVVFPSRCPACARALAHPTRGPLCEACWDALPRHRGRLCGCGLPLPPALALCGRCRRGRQTFTAGVSLGPYEGGLRTVIHKLKYRGKRRVAVRLAEALLAAPGAQELLRGSDVLVPVPLHPRRRRERGFNQAEVLAQELARRVGRPCAPAQRRRSFRGPPPHPGGRAGGDARGRRPHHRSHRPRLRPRPARGGGVRSTAAGGG